MGYRGEDASRQRAESRRQTPWQSSSDAYASAGDYDDYDDHAPDDYGRGGYGHSGGYPAQPGGHGGSGGYPVLGDGAEQEDVSGRYAGNDWYGRPGGASGSGFADTGTYNLDARAIDSYGTGPRPQLPEAGVARTGQQERYDDRYEQYPEYENTGYGAPPGHDQGGYDQGYDEPEDYADRYENPYGAAPPAGKAAKKNKKNKAKAKATATAAKSKNSRGPRRGKRRLLLAACTVVVLAVAAGAGYLFVFKHKPSPASSTSTGPLPSPGSTSAATAACVKQFGQYCHIELRTNDPAPLTLAELFPPAFANENDHSSFTQASTKLDKTCSSAVIGQDLVTALQTGKCTQVLRASYVSGDNKIMGTIGVVNLDTTSHAHAAGKLVGTNDFVAPLATAKGVASKLGKGTGIVEAEYKGHYLILIWAEFTSTDQPANNAQNRQLQQFGNDLIAGTANIALSQRMVNGVPATAAANPG